MSEQARQNSAAKKSDQQTATQPSFILTEGAESWAAPRLARWGKPQKDDYDFRSWAARASEDLLNAGCIYEYARESYEFRCLCALDRRERGQFSGILIKFETSSVGFTWLTNSGWGTWLHDFADELVANKSFAHLLRANPNKLRKSLDDLPSYSLFPRAVEKPGRHIISHGGDAQPEFGYPGSQVVSIQFFWRLYTNAEIGEEMKRLAGELRPAREPGPKRRGKGKASSTESLLDALSAMRLASHLRKRDAIIRFSDIQLGKIGRIGDADVAPANFNKLIEKAKRSFALMFPFGENPANAVDFSERQRTK